jgi:hypothetical protein
MNTLTRSYDDFSDAKEVVSELKAAGIPEHDISLIANKKDDSIADGMATGAGVGGALGAGAGLLTGLGLLAIPGVGPVVAAGWLATLAVGAAAGAAAGAATGGLIDALTSSGVNEKDAHAYAESVRRGAALVSVRVPESMSLTAQEILDSHDPIDFDARRRDWEKTGWTSFDPDAGPYVSDPTDTHRDRPLS